MKKLFSLFIPFLLLVSCATIPNFYEQELMLQNNLTKWEEFKLNGIVELNYKQFAFRKNIYINKKQQNIDLKVFDGGIFGMAPKPFLTAKMDSILWVSQQGGELKPFQIPIFPGIEFLQNPNLLLSYKDDIIKNGEILIDNKTFIQFSKNMVITNIENIDYSYKLSLKYNPELSQIIITENKKVLLKIDVDKISYKRK